MCNKLKSHYIHISRNWLCYVLQNNQFQRGEPFYKFLPCHRRSVPPPFVFKTRGTYELPTCCNSIKYHLITPSALINSDKMSHRNKMQYLNTLELEPHFIHQCRHFWGSFGFKSRGNRRHAVNPLNIVQSSHSAN